MSPYITSTCTVHMPYQEERALICFFSETGSVLFLHMQLLVSVQVQLYIERVNNAAFGSSES